MNAPRDATLRRIEDLAAADLVTPDAVPALGPVARRYAIALTPHLAGLIDRADPHDPIARQFVPDPREALTTPDERADPIGDFAHAPVKGVVHRYPDRVLLKPVHVCPVYCRFCFRREQVGPGAEMLDAEALEAALDYIRARPSIREVILTGGDPLMLAPRRLGALVASLDAIAHVATIRIHSRVPIADPARISADLVEALDVETPVWLSVHCNHARELSAETRAALRRLSRAGIPLLAQTVLLRGVNDDARVLADLFATLYANRVKPYYLHHPDLAPGTGHFRLSIAEGRALMAEVWRSIPGPARPTYVLDIPGGRGKAALGPEAVAPASGGTWAVTGLDGIAVAYPPDADPA